MLVELLSTAIDKAIQLLQARQDRREKYLDEFVTPLYEQFESLHQAYLESFRSYRHELETGKDFAGTAGILLQRLATDNLFTAQQRAKAVEYIRLVASLPWSADPLSESIREFVETIGYYSGLKDLLWAAPELDGATRASEFYRRQLWRTGLASGIRIVMDSQVESDSGRREMALKYLDWSVEHMQELYQRATQAYAAIKHEILKGVRP